MPAQPTTLVLPPRLHALAALAHLLERLERRPRAASAGQYRQVVQRLIGQLEAAQNDALLGAVLGAFPATAELYENLRYAQAGLCRSPLEAALNAEVVVGRLLQGLRRPPAGGPGAQPNGTGPQRTG